MKICSLKEYDGSQTAPGIVIYDEPGDLTVKQIDTVSLTGTGGTCVITGGGLPAKVATFSGNLTTTTGNFVTANAAAYLAVGVVLTSNVADLIFTASEVGVPFSHPRVLPATTNLTGTVVRTQGTGERIMVQMIPFDGLTITKRFIENYKNLINGYKYTNKTVISLRSAVHDFDLECQSIENQPEWTDGELTGLELAFKEINSWNDSEVLPN